MTAATISDKLLGIVLPLTMVEAVTSNAKKANTKRKLNKGLKMLTAGLSLTCDGINEILDDNINELMNEQTANCTDEELVQIMSFVEQLNPYIGLVDSESVFPQELTVKIAELFERLNIYVNLERQMRDNSVIPTTIDIEALNKAVKRNSKGFETTWVEA